MGEFSGVHATVDAAGVEVAAGTGVAAGAAATAAFAAGAPPPSVYVLNAPTSALLLTMIASSLPTGTSFVPAGTTIFEHTLVLRLERQRRLVRLDLAQHVARPDLVPLQPPHQSNRRKCAESSMP